MAQLFTNNAASELTAAISDTDTSISVTATTGADFPNPTAPDYFLVTLMNTDDTEIVKVTARSGDTMTIVRAQEGTTAAAFAIGALVELRVTAGTMRRRRALDPYLREELEEAEDRVWWGRHEY